MQEMQDQLENLSVRLTKVESIQIAHREQSARIDANITDLIETFNALKGAWVVLNFVGKLAKPVGYLMTFFGALYYYKEHLKDIIK